MAFDITPGFNLPNIGEILNRLPGGQAVGTAITSRTSPQSTRQGGTTFLQPNLSLSGGGQVAGASTTRSGGGSSSDPYAKYGGKTGYDRLMSGFDTQKGNIFGTSREAAENAAIGRQSSILDFIDTLRSGQRGIDERGIQNELAKRQGSASILDMVGRGIRQGGTLLAGKNASDSSAAEGIARAYGDVGRRELSKVGNQYELENRNLGIAQTDLDTQRASGLRKFDESKTQTVNGIVAEARDKLAALDAAMVEADMPTRVAIEQEKEAIKAEALGVLSRFDQQLAEGAGGVRPTSVDERRRTAAELATAGVAAENPFEFSTQAPAQFQGTGPFPTELPLFRLSRFAEDEV